MRKKIYIGLLLLLYNFRLFAGPQPDDKYWYQRWRLTNYFMLQGEGRGKGIPIGIRNLYGAATTATGDAPNYLGAYIGILATEYYLNTQSGLSNKKTLEEIYYAMKAINRLDASETQFPWLMSVDKLDGCMGRGDWPNDIVQNNQSILNKNMYEFSKSFLGDPAFINANEYQPDINASRQAGVLSKDHMSSLLVGLALVKNFMPADVSYQGLNIQSEAVNITNRLLGYLQNTCGWNTLKDPLGNDIPEQWGGKNLGSISYGIAKAAEYVNPLGNYTNGTPAFSKIKWQGAAGLDDVVGGVEVVTGSSQAHNAWIILNLASVGSSWGVFESTKTNISNLSAQYGWEAYYPVLWSVLHGDRTGVNETAIATDLNAMPFGGNYNLNGSKSDKWATSHKYHDTPTENSNGDSYFPGKFTGLEYMLAFNLNLIYHNQHYNKQECNNITVNNTSELGLTASIYNHLYGNNIVLNGNVIIPSGENLKAIGSNTVDLKPGFSAVNGSTFIGRINTYACGHNGPTTDLSICGGASKVLFVDAVPDAYSYAWSYPTGWTGPSVTDGTSITVAFNNKAQYGDVICTPKLNGGSVGSAIVFHITYATGLPTAATDMGAVPSPTTCYYEVEAYGIVGATSYIWSKNSSFIPELQTTSVSRTDKARLSPGLSYTFYVKARNVCGTSPVYSGTFQTPQPIGSCRFATNVDNTVEDVEQSISIYPNPNTGNFTLDTKEDLVTCEIYNAMGSLVYNKQLKGKQNVDLNESTKGIYILKITRSNGQLSIHKFVVE